MAGIRQRKKNLILAGLVGALLIGLPLLGTSVYFALENLAVRQQLEEYKEKEKKTDTYLVYTLNRDLKRGEQIEKGDITAITVIGDMISEEIFSLKSPIGKKMKITANSGTVLSDSLITEENLPQEDERKVELDYVKIPELLAEGEMVDIRIRFQNGEDYIVAGQKEVFSLRREQGYQEGNLLEILVNEEEILKLASAKADCDIYENTNIYAVIYAEEGQKKAEDTYPVNPSVYTLSTWDPNVGVHVLTEKNQEKRTVLEENLKEFFFSEDVP